MLIYLEEDLCMVLKIYLKIHNRQTMVDNRQTMVDNRQTMVDNSQTIMGFNSQTITDSMIFLNQLI